MKARDLRDILAKLGAEPLSQRPRQSQRVVKLLAQYRAPTEYRQFVLQSPALHVSANLEVGDSTFLVDYLVGGTAAGTHSLVESVEDDVQGLPIAGDLGGNRFFLMMGQGGVCFWDHETGELVKVANGFAEFLRGLEPRDDEGAAGARPLREDGVEYGLLSPGGLSDDEQDRLREQKEAFQDSLDEAVARYTGEDDWEERPVWCFSVYAIPAFLRAAEEFCEQTGAELRRWADDGPFEGS